MEIVSKYFIMIQPIFVYTNMNILLYERMRLRISIIFIILNL